ncbi:hypothetical protein PLICRDRAFT_41352 [Plicaturopsis crispa FD-325 SS-3]|nr:hypothetical protein PLICRDRAFT_41352 [Plicaturopsis crispa FD-325 SS-3]
MLRILMISPQAGLYLAIGLTWTQLRGLGKMSGLRPGAGLCTVCAFYMPAAVVDLELT